MDGVCIVSEVGGVCGLGIVCFLDEVYILGGFYNLDVACFLDEDCVLSGVIVFLLLGGW